MTTDQDLKISGEAQPAAAADEGEDITPKKDRGVLKIIKRAGTENETPMIGDRVSIHHKGMLLNGKVFDSTHERTEPFTFHLGRGQVIKSWDIAVATMKKKEVCQLICKPEYGYGTAGSPPEVPPNSTLKFEIELLDFSGEDLYEDGGIIKRIKVKGEGYSYPNEGATVEIYLEGRCNGQLFDRRDVKYVIGEGEDHNIPSGVDKALEKMQKGEYCLLHLKSQYGFGDAGKHEFSIGPDMELDYEVTLKSFEKAKESWEMNTKEKVEQAAIAKEKGTAYFKALELDNTNEKGLYRRGEARLFMNEFDLANIDFHKVLEVNSENKAAKSQIAVCRKKIKEHNEREKRVYANMFQKFANQDAKKEGRKPSSEKDEALGKALEDSSDEEYNEEFEDEEKEEE